MRCVEALLNVLEREEIDRRVRQGYRAEMETGESAQLVKPKRLSIMCLLISIVTLVGWIPYLGYQLLLKREASVYLTLEPDGSVASSGHRR